MAATDASIVGRVLRHDRKIVLGSLVGLTLLSWAYILSGAGMPVRGDTGMPVDGEAMSMAPAAWDLGYAVIVLVMWAVMMTAMMLPLAAPTVLIYATVHRRRLPGAAPHRAVASFVFGYLTVWAAFSGSAMTLQWQLSKVAMLSPMLEVTSVAQGGALLAAAGLYQMTPLKDACLKHCRSPMEFVATHWREGTWGALRMGLEHATFCVGCCWVLMTLLFYGGVMNLWWIAGLSAYVLAERLTAHGHRLHRVIGIALIGWAIAVLTAIL